MTANYLRKALLFISILFVFLINAYAVPHAKAATTFDISKKNVIISKSGDYTITGSTDTYTIQVKKGVSANITLKNVTITNPKDKRLTKDLMDIKSGASVNLILIGSNIINNGWYGAAIHVPYGAKLTINAGSTGSLTAIAGGGSAGIGGSAADITGETGTIIINGGTIYAEGGYDNCGIGGGTVIREDFTIYKSKYIGGGDITINGGKVTAVGGKQGGAAGIGGTSLTRQGKIAINGGEVEASSWEAGIGGEALDGKGNMIKITGGIITANGNTYAAAIGNNMDSDGTIVTITGGTVTAKGDYGSRTLYEPCVSDFMVYSDKLKACDIAAEKIIISGGNIRAYTLSEQPTDDKGKAVYPCFVNCAEGNITSITYGSKSYGAKNVLSEGYLRLFLPVTSGLQKLTIKSGNKILYRDYYYFGGNLNPLVNEDKQTTMTINISEGNVELIDGGCIFKNKVYRCDNITITGTTTNHKILVHPSTSSTQSIVFNNLTIDYETYGAQDFIIIDNDVTLNIRLEGESFFHLGNEVRGVFIGNKASLSFSGDSDKDSLIVSAGEKSKVFYTNIGNVIQYGGLLQFRLGENSAAIDTGNFGTFTLCGGTFEAKEAGFAITGLYHMRVNIYGGTLTADAIGVPETGNEEVSNRTIFIITGGAVKAKERIIFSEYKIYGGSINTRILGCGTGADIWMYGGSLEIGAYIDYKAEKLGLDIYEENILGGTINQRNDVPMEEIELIKTDRG